VEPVGEFKDDPAVQALAAVPHEFIPCRVALAPLVDETTPPNGDSTFEAPIPKPAAEIFSDLTGTIKDFNTFKDLRILEHESDVIKGEEFNRETFLAQAESVHADMLMTLSLKRFRTCYLGTNGNHLPSIALWVSLWWPSWFIADEDYSSDITLAMDVHSAKTKELVDQKVFTVSSRFDLDDFQRGWQFCGLLFVPGSLGEGNWKAVSDIITPHAVRDLKLQMLTYTRSNEFRERVLAKVVKKKGSSIALVVGVNDYAAENVPDISFAEEDAAAVHNRLQESGEFGRDDVILLKGKDATSAAVRGKLGGIFSGHLAGRPKVFIYFACHGAVHKGEPALVFHDYDPADSSTVLLLSELAKTFDAMPAEQLVLVCDTGLGATENARGLSTGDAATGIKDDYIDALASRPGRAILFSSRGGESAAEAKHKKQGLFTFFFLQSLKGPADSAGNKDGFVSLKEIYENTHDKVTRQAGLLRVKQHPVLKGPGADKPVFKVAE
jgi:hypothetical protein